MRIGIFIGHFPVISETFVLRQLTGLLDMGQDIHVYADWAPDEAETQIWDDWRRYPVHPEIARYGMLERTTYMRMPLAVGYWKHPVWPLTGKTWLPQELEPERNAVRALRALPVLLRAAVRAPRLTADVLRPDRFEDAEALTPLYRLSRLCADGRRFDVLQAHFGWTGRNWLFAPRLLKAPLVVSFHGGGDLCLGHVDPVEHYGEMFRAAAAITANSLYVRGQLLDAGCPEEKIHQIEESVEIERFPFRERRRGPGEETRIVSVGRLVEMKGHAYTIRALALARRSHPDVRLDIVGEGYLRDELEELIEELGLRDVVTLHGALPGDAVTRLLDRAHLFALASVKTQYGDTEGQGVVLQEAQAAGLPVLATTHGPFPEGVLDGRSGLLAPERDAEALAANMVELLDHPERWPEMGRAGRRHVEERYDSRMLNRRLLDLLEGVAADGRR